jgi:hypothetical protein
LVSFWDYFEGGGKNLEFGNCDCSKYSNLTSEELEFYKKRGSVPLNDPNWAKLSGDQRREVIDYCSREERERRAKLAEQERLREEQYRARAYVNPNIEKEWRERVAEYELAGCIVKILVICCVFRIAQYIICTILGLLFS